jgi:NMD protein affecting ribosome stability and mRNA decay
MIGFQLNELNVENSKLIHKRLAKNKIKYKIPKFKVGDVVRIPKYKHVFSKVYTPNWTGELFTIAEVKKTRPVTYILKDEEDNRIKGGFYKEELQRRKEES